MYREAVLVRHLCTSVVRQLSKASETVVYKRYIWSETFVYKRGETVVYRD